MSDHHLHESALVSVRACEHSGSGVESKRECPKDAEIARLNAIINTPQYDDFLRAVSIEAEHQRQRWGESHDASKTPDDWYRLIGHLASKALDAHTAGDKVKAEHHILTTAAALKNWHRAFVASGLSKCPVQQDGRETCTTSLDGSQQRPAGQSAGHELARYFVRDDDGNFEEFNSDVTRDNGHRAAIRDYLGDGMTGCARNVVSGIVTHRTGQDGLDLAPVRLFTGPIDGGERDHYDGNHVENNCPECNERDSECDCVSGQSADTVEHQSRENRASSANRLALADSRTPYVPTPPSLLGRHEGEAFETWWVRDVPPQFHYSVLDRQRDGDGYLSGSKIKDARDGWLAALNYAISTLSGSGEVRRDAERYRIVREMKASDFENLSIRLPTQIDKYVDAVAIRNNERKHNV